MQTTPLRDTIMTGASCYNLLKQYVDIPEDVTGFKISIEADNPPSLLFVKFDWSTQTIRKLKGIIAKDSGAEFCAKLLEALGVTNLGEVSSVVVEVKGYDDIVITTIQQATTHGQLEDCLKLLKGESQ